MKHRINEDVGHTLVAEAASPRLIEVDGEVLYKDNLILYQTCPRKPQLLRELT